MNAAEQNAEYALNIIKSHKNGLTLDEIWNQVKQYTAPYSIAELLDSGRIKSVQQGNKHCLYYCRTC